jgi:sulfate adenylyltransferase
MTPLTQASYGGQLVDLIVDSQHAEDFKRQSMNWPSMTLSSRQLSDLTLLMNGGFSPLRGFLRRDDYDSVVNEMRLEDGTIWPIPICLDVSEKMASGLETGQRMALLDREGFMLAVLNIEEIWRPDKSVEAEKVFGTTDPAHPGVAYLFRQSGSHYVGGVIEGIQHPLHFAFRRYRHTPVEIRRLYRKLGWRRIVGFHTHNPLHRAQYEITLRAMEAAKANLLLHPIVQRVKHNDIDAYTRVRCYLRIAEKYPPNMMLLSLLPLTQRMAGPREALLHAIVRKNYGCTHFIVGWRHAEPFGRGEKDCFYEPGAAAKLAYSLEEELGINIITFDEMVYAAEEDTYQSSSEIRDSITTRRMSDHDFHERFRAGKPVPDWFTFSTVSEELRKAYPARHGQGVTIFFTGLSGAGKSTIAKVLQARFLEMGGRPVTLLDGDIVRTNLSSELGFSKDDRDINVRRIGFVASEITKNRGIAICAPIAPYAATRQTIREQIEQYGGFVEVHVNTPIEVCEQRDRKGLYAKARAGQITGFTGVDDPYEAPAQPEVAVDTTDMTPDEAAQEVLLYLERAGFIK